MADCFFVRKMLTVCMKLQARKMWSISTASCLRAGVPPIVAAPRSLTTGATRRASCRGVRAGPWYAPMSAGLASSRISLTVFMLRWKRAMRLLPLARQDQCSRWQAL